MKGLTYLPTYLPGLLLTYSSLSNKRAGWNKRAGRKFCQILGNFENLNLCMVDLSHFKWWKWTVIAKISIKPSNGDNINAANHKLRKKWNFLARIFPKINKLCSTFIRETRVLYTRPVSYKFIQCSSATNAECWLHENCSTFENVFNKIFWNLIIERIKWCLSSISKICSNKILRHDLPAPGLEPSIN